ncbi:MAG: integrase arm-type DNA-binding domain-containing protein [Acetobacter indonesiensis]|jgi:integrase|nr:integrase arm-type DNA-binding domain-containing protein [Acetobacter indonesiensis]MCI1547112.1 integrase arm-type DNA-binding domain-containing protein [Acetobacter indonesiensis]MCI1766483.1 integrase arm-type DNA-binding domain-containing protein [Acetobacter indonesiensis]
MLTDVQLRRLTPREKPYKLSDTGGLFIFVQTSGSRLWRMKYRFGGKEKLFSFGAYPEVTLAAAREARDQARAEIRAGRDPSLTRRQRQAEAKRVDKQLRHVGEKWMEAQSARWTARHAEDVRTSLERLAWPDLGHIDLDDITAPMVLETIKKIEAGRAKETARRVRQRLSAIFLFGMAHGLGTHDPASVIKGALAPLKKGRQPAIVDLEELRHLFHEVEAIPAHPVTLLAMRFLALTVVRPGEVHAMAWHELSEDGSLWIIPAERMKMRREHCVPLSLQAQDILRTVSVLTGKGPLVFPNARWAHRPMSENALSYLLQRAGYAGRQVPHGFRASFSSIMNEQFPGERMVIDMMLAHMNKDRVEAAYNRAQHMERRRQLAQIWADLLMSGAPDPVTLLQHRKR